VGTISPHTFYTYIFKEGDNVKGILIILFLLLSVNIANAGTINGWVYDSEGVPLEYVKVTVVSTGQYEITDSTGRYILSDIGPNGVYYISAELDNYITQTISSPYVSYAHYRVNFFLIYIPPLTGLLEEFNLIITYICEMFISIASVFMQPPLIILIVISGSLYIFKRIKK